MEFKMKIFVIAALSIFTVTAASAQTRYYGPSGQYLGSSQSFGGGQTSFYGSSGQYLGSASR
jgi:hypothetical protein